MEKLSHIPLKLVLYGKSYTTDFSGIWDNLSIYNSCSIIFMVNITSTHLILVIYGKTFLYTTIFYIYNYFFPYLTEISEI